MKILQLYIGRFAIAECSNLDSLAYAFVRSIIRSRFIDILYKLRLSQNVLNKGFVIPSDRFCRHTRKSSLLFSSRTSRPCYVLVRQLAGPKKDL